MREAVFWLGFILCPLAVQAYYYKHGIFPTQEIQGKGEGGNEGLQSMTEPTVSYLCEKCFCLAGLLICTWRSCDDNAWVHESKCDSNINSQNKMEVFNGKFNAQKKISGAIPELSSSFLRGRGGAGGSGGGGGGSGGSGGNGGGGGWWGYSGEDGEDGEDGWGGWGGGKGGNGGGWGGGKGGKGGYGGWWGGGKGGNGGGWGGGKGGNGGGWGGGKGGKGGGWGGGKGGNGGGWGGGGGGWGGGGGGGGGRHGRVHTEKGVDENGGNGGNAWSISLTGGWDR